MHLCSCLEDCLQSGFSSDVIDLILGVWRSDYGISALSRLSEITHTGYARLKDVDWNIMKTIGRFVFPCFSQEIASSSAQNLRPVSTQSCYRWRRTKAPERWTLLECYNVNTRHSRCFSLIRKQSLSTRKRMECRRRLTSCYSNLVSL